MDGNDGDDCSNSANLVFTTHEKALTTEQIKIRYFMVPKLTIGVI